MSGLAKNCFRLTERAERRVPAKDQQVNDQQHDNVSTDTGCAPVGGVGETVELGADHGRRFRLDQAARDEGVDTDAALNQADDKFNRRI